MTVSIIIVTRNRAGDLVPTLESMKGVHLPDGVNAELLVIDNGSTDETKDVVERFRHPTMEVRHVLEERPGLSRGRNRAIIEAKGDYLLCTDDDIRPPEQWLSAMLEPLVSGKADAVCGGVRLAPHLVRPWMTPTHRSWLASTEWLGNGELRNVVGANMGFSRAVFAKVPGFDEELGAGALGCFEEVLFSSQLVQAGCRIFNRLDVSVEHHFQESRLRRESWLDAAWKMGVSQAYVGHHWHHWSCRFGTLRRMRASLRLKAWRKAYASRITSEGCDEIELKLVLAKSLVTAHIRESANPRKYEHHGLVKLTPAA